MFVCVCVCVCVYPCVYLCVGTGSYVFDNRSIVLMDMFRLIYIYIYGIRIIVHANKFMYTHLAITPPFFCCLVKRCRSYHGLFYPLSPLFCVYNGKDQECWRNSGLNHSMILISIRK